MNGERKTILVVDDVPEDILILNEILKKEYQVKAVTNGPAALEIARSGNPPDLILLDIIMPGMDGFEVCRRLREDAEGAVIPVIFLTAKVTTSDEKKGLELGAADYIKKPIDPELVLRRVKTHLEQVDRTLRLSEVRFRRLFEASMDGIVVVDAKSGMVVDANPAMAAIMGVSQEYFLGRSVSEIDFLTTIFRIDAGCSEIPVEGYVRKEEGPVETLDGRMVHLETVCNAYTVNKRSMLQFNIRDISDLVEAKRERDDLAERLSHYLFTSPTVTYAIELVDGRARWQWVSANVERLLGYSREEVLAGNWWQDNIHPADRREALETIADLARHRTSAIEYRFFKKDRSVVWLRDEVRLAHECGDSEIVGTLTDITSRKKAEEENQLKGVALEAAANAVVITDRQGALKWVNRAFQALTGYSKEEAIGMVPHDYLRPEEAAEGTFRKMLETALSGAAWKGEMDGRKKSGEPYTQEVTLTPVLDRKGEIENFIAIINDTSERKKARDRLEALLREKSVLLREIHHRVNNNSQIMIGLLNLSAVEVQDAEIRGKLEDITRRMQSMATIHQQFYESEDTSRIDFALYLHRLLDGLKPAFPRSLKNASLSCELGRVFLNLEKAIPAALIVNELLTNAIRFAFPEGGADGFVEITLRLEDGEVEVEVKDDGIGLPSDFDPDTAQSLGMALMRILADQLGGRVDFRRRKGTDAILRFPL